MTATIAQVLDGLMGSRIPVAVLHTSHLNDRTDRASGTAVVVPQDQELSGYLGNMVDPELLSNIERRKPWLGYVNYAQATQPGTEELKNLLGSADYLGNSLDHGPEGIEILRMLCKFGEAHDPVNPDQLNINAFREFKYGDGSIRSAGDAIAQYLGPESPIVVKMPPVPHLGDITKENIKPLLSATTQISEAFPNSQVVQPMLPQLMHNYRRML